MMKLRVALAAVILVTLALCAQGANDDDAVENQVAEPLPHHHINTRIGWDSHASPLSRPSSLSELSEASKNVIPDDPLAQPSETSVSAAQTQLNGQPGGYVVGGKNTNSCPIDSEPIGSCAACEVAAHAKGLTWKKCLKTGSQLCSWPTRCNSASEYPKGCFFHDNPHHSAYDSVYFNEHAPGSAQIHSKPLCKTVSLSPTPVPTPVPTPSPTEVPSPSPTPVPTRSALSHYTEHVGYGCGSGNNLGNNNNNNDPTIWTDKTPEECAVQCRNLTNCVGFMYTRGNGNKCRFKSDTSGSRQSSGSTSCYKLSALSYFTEHVGYRCGSGNNLNQNNEIWTDKTPEECAVRCRNLTNCVGFMYNRGNGNKCRFKSDTSGSGQSAGSASCYKLNSAAQPAVTSVSAVQTQQLWGGRAIPNDDNVVENQVAKGFARLTGSLSELFEASKNVIPDDPLVHGVKNGGTAELREIDIDLK